MKIDSFDYILSKNFVKFQKNGANAIVDLSYEEVNDNNKVSRHNFLKSVYYLKNCFSIQNKNN